MSNFDYAKMEKDIVKKQEISEDNPLAVDSYQDIEKFDNLDRKDLLENILFELKKINMHLQTITDERIKEDDIECQ